MHLFESWFFTLISTKVNIYVKFRRIIFVFKHLLKDYKLRGIVNINVEYKLRGIVSNHEDYELRSIMNISED